MTTSSGCDRDDFCRWLHLIACNLFPVQLFQNCFHFSEINIVTRGTSSAAGIFMGVTRRERADFAAMSAFSLQEISTWLGITTPDQHLKNPLHAHFPELTTTHLTTFNKYISRDRGRWSALTHPRSQPSHGKVTWHDTTYLTYGMVPCLVTLTDL